jgi:hypothetical protein
MIDENRRLHSSSRQPRVLSEIGMLRQLATVMSAEWHLQLSAKSENQNTRNGTLLDSELLGVVTITVPVVDPGGTVAVISVADTTVNAVAVPLKVTLVVPVRS